MISSHEAMESKNWSSSFGNWKAIKIGKIVRARFEIDVLGKNGNETPSGDCSFL